MSGKLSALTANVLATVSASQISGAQCNLMIGGDLETFKACFNNTSSIPMHKDGPVYPSGFITVSGTNTPFVQSGEGWENAQGDLTSNGNTWTIPGTISLPNSGGMPYIGDPLPNWTPNVFPPQPNPFIPTVWPAPSTVPAEDGVYDVPGGKVIVKKIVVTEEAVEAAMEKELARKPTAAELAKVKHELDELAHYEDRDI